MSRPVIMIVERKRKTSNFGPELEITGVRRMNAAEYAWHCIKKALTHKPEELEYAAVNTNTMNKAGMASILAVGIELSPELWTKVVTDSGHDAVVWLNKHSSVLLSPVPPSSVPVTEDAEVCEV